MRACRCARLGVACTAAPLITAAVTDLPVPAHEHHGAIGSPAGRKQVAETARDLEQGRGSGVGISGAVHPAHMDNTKQQCERM